MNYAIIGFGGLGKLHFSDTAEIKSKAEDVKLVAICDVDETKFVTKTETNLGGGNDKLDLSAYNLYTDVEEMLKKERLDFVITALPTYLHEKIAVKVMEYGVNVFSEKPIAINLEQAQNMIDTSKKYNVKLMIGQCVRYFPEYRILKEMIDSEKYGRVISADFWRLSQTPTWSWQNWMLDEEKSGGAALDLHIHDVDFIHYVFGKPKAVTSRAANTDTKHDSISTIFDYDNMFVTATGAWGLKAKYPFTVGFTVRFENATLEYKNGALTLYTDTEETEIEIPKENGYVSEIVDFIDCIKNNRESKINTPETAKLSIEIGIAEKISADRCETVIL